MLRCFVGLFLLGLLGSAGAVIMDVLGILLGCLGFQSLKGPST